MKRDYEDLGGADPWDVLGVTREADDAAIKRAHRQRTPTQHPDAGGDHLGQTRLNLARDVLLDPIRRRDYADRLRMESTTPPADPPSADVPPVPRSAPRPPPAPKPAAPKPAARKPGARKPAAPKPGRAKAARPESAAEYEDLIRRSAAAGSRSPRVGRKRFQFVPKSVFAPTSRTRPASARVPPPIYRRYPPSPRAGYPSYAPAYSGLAVASLALSVFCFPVGLPLAIFAIVECRQSGRRGAALAYIAIGVSLVMVVVTCSLYLLVAGVDTPASRSL